MALTHLQLAESVWNPQKKRSEIRIVYNCGRAEDPDVAAQLRRLARSIRGGVPPEEIVTQEPDWRLVDVAVWRSLCPRDAVASARACRRDRAPCDAPEAGLLRGTRALFAMVANGRARRVPNVGGQKMGAATCRRSSWGWL